MLGDKLLKLRKKQGYSQQEVADLLEVSRQTISNWESDQGAPALDKAIELARLYHIDLNDLVSNEVEVFVAHDEQGGEGKAGKDLHLLEALKGKTCIIDTPYLGWMINQADKKAKVVEANSDWVKVEYQRAKGMNPRDKEIVVQLLDVDTIKGFTLLEDDH